MTPFTCIFENNCECYPQLTTFSEHGGHFGRHLGFWEKLQGDFRGVLVCDSTQFSGPILKNIACYGRLPPFCHFWANTLGLLGCFSERDSHGCCIQLPMEVIPSGVAKCLDAGEGGGGEGRSTPTHFSRPEKLWQIIIMGSRAVADPRGGGAQQARAPLKLDQLCFFFYWTNFFSIYQNA